MYIVKAWAGLWVTVFTCATKDAAELYQDGMWLNMPETITEIEYRGF